MNIPKHRAGKLWILRFFGQTGKFVMHLLCISWCLHGIRNYFRRIPWSLSRDVERVRGKVSHPRLVNYFLLFAKTEVRAESWELRGESWDDESWELRWWELRGQSWDDKSKLTAFLQTVLKKGGSLLEILQNLQRNERLNPADVLKKFTMDMFEKNNSSLFTILTTLSYSKTEVNQCF